MIVFANIIYSLCLPAVAEDISIKIYGYFDLGPKWNHEYRSLPLRSQTERTNVSALKITKYYDDFGQNSNQIFAKTHKVSDDVKIKHFVEHVGKQALGVFHKIKEKFDGLGVRKKVDILMNNYRDKFRKFVNETKNRKVKTRLGSQKVVLNTIDTSNRILKRLVNYLVGNMGRKEILRNTKVENVFLNEVTKEREIELKHACQKFGFCRSSNNFIDFFNDFLTELIKCDLKQTKEAADALTEVLKSANFSKIMDEKSKEKFDKVLEMIEYSSALEVRNMFSILRKVLTNKDHPISVVDEASEKVVNKTVAFLDVVDIFDKTTIANEANALEWEDITNSIKRWKNDKGANLFDIMQALYNNVNKAIMKFDYETSVNVSNKIRIVLK